MKRFVPILSGLLGLSGIALAAPSAIAPGQAGQLFNQWKKQTGDSTPKNPTPNRQAIHERAKMTEPHCEFPGAAHNATTINHPDPIRLK